MSDITIVVTILAALGAALFAVAGHVSEALVRACAHRLSPRIALRMEEEWLAELNEIANRPAKLAFAIALTFTRRRAFVVPGEDYMTEIHDRPAGLLASFNGRKTLLTLSTLIFAIAAYGASFLLPVRYASESLIVIQRRTISTDFVKDLTGDPAEQSRAIVQVVLSRTSLVSIVHQFPELKTGRKNWSVDRLIEELGKDITVQFPPSTEGAKPQYFRLRYLGRNPELAQKVTMKLTQSFIEQDFRNREDSVSGTSEFLRSRLEMLADRLNEKGQELARERAAHGPEAGRILAIDYDLLKATYANLFTRYQETQLTAALESQSRGTQFMIQDAANLGTPVVPNRLAIAGIGALSGFVLGGIAVVGLGRRHRRALA